MAAALIRSVWRGEHSQAPSHLLSAGAPGRGASNHLRRLVALKTGAEYDPAPVSAKTAESAVRAAERLVAIADQVLATTSGQ